jgi:ankyrin repeat protein
VCEEALLLSIMPAMDIDAGSRYPRPEVTVKMHGTDYDGQIIKDQYKEARRKTMKSNKKWMEAAEKGEMMRIVQLLDDGQDINENCQPGDSTALYVAARTNNLRLAELLLKRGADPSILTPDLVSPAWIAISRGFDEMVELLLDPQWSAKLVEYVKTETAEMLAKSDVAGIQQTHYELAVMRRYWRCVYLIEAAIGVEAEKSKIPTHYFEPPSGWAVGMAPSEPGQRPDMPMHPFYWKAFTKNAECVTEPPEGSKKLQHKGGGRFEEVKY